MELSAKQALGMRMRSLLLASDSPRCESAEAVVTWFGAMQAQEIGSGLWSLGVRLPGSTIDHVRAALEDRSVLRTWPMRGTVHFVPARDARWMLELTGVKALRSADYRRRNLGLDEATANRAVDVLGAALLERGRMTRAECLAAIEQGGISTDRQLGYHLLWYASQLGISCIAPNIGTAQTFALLDDWAPEQAKPDREEALATLAIRYFRSHGPTTDKDFAGWTGLTLTEAREAIAAAGDGLADVEVDGVTMFAAPQIVESLPIAPTGEIRVLPGFDEYMLGFKDRSMMVDDAHMRAIVPGGNGVFQATIVRGGRVVGTWKRKSTSKAKAVLTVTPLASAGARARRAIEAAFEPYAAYLDQPVDLVWPD